MTDVSFLEITRPSALTERRYNAFAEIPVGVWGRDDGREMKDEIQRSLEWFQ